MTEATVRNILAMEPFEPITLHMASRTSYDISRPESVTIPPGGGVLNIHVGGRWIATLALDHIVSIETVPRPVTLSAAS